MPPAIEPVATKAPLTELEQEGLDYRRRYQGLIGIGSKVHIRDRAILSLVYTPGVAEACLAINEDPLASFDLTCRGNTVAILTDGSDIFGRESGPPEAAIPLEEAKSVIFKTFAGVDAFPLSLATSDPDRIVETGLALSPTFGAICLDDISAPRAFTIADNLENGADIPVFSNQHHGTAILALGGLINALKVVGKGLEEVKVVISGAGVAGIGVARLLTRAGVRDLVVCDRAGALYKYRPERMNWAKAYLTKETNLAGRRGSLTQMLAGASIRAPATSACAHCSMPLRRWPTSFCRRSFTPTTSCRASSISGSLRRWRRLWCAPRWRPVRRDGRSRRSWSASALVASSMR